MSNIRIGISGWTYAPWRGTFFPPDLIQKQELAYASRKISSIEVNGTFYALQKPSSYAHWYEQTPKNFIFSIKAPRFITHIKRLKESAPLIANFFASGVLRLEEKLGPILWQVPPSLRYERERLTDFLSTLPRDTSEAAAMAQKHDESVSETWTTTNQRRPLRHALEIRNKSFVNPEFVSLLRQYNVALVIADTAGKWPLMEDVTADFVYIRLHGDSELYVSGYTPTALKMWAKKIRTWSRGENSNRKKLISAPISGPAGGRDIYVYFDNDAKIRAPYDAMNLAFLLKLGAKPTTSAPSASTIAQLQSRSRWPGPRKRKRRVPAQALLDLDPAVI